MSESTLSLSQGLWIWPLTNITKKRIRGGGKTVRLEISCRKPAAERGEGGGVTPILHWQLSAVCDLTSDSRLSTYDESVLKLSKDSFRIKCARTGHPLKLPSPTKIAQLCHFLAIQAGGLAGLVFYVFFSPGNTSPLPTPYFPGDPWILHLRTT